LTVLLASHQVQSGLAAVPARIFVGEMVIKAPTLRAKSMRDQAQIRWCGFVRSIGQIAHAETETVVPTEKREADTISLSFQ
jgi:hypothetical protein